MYSTIWRSRFRIFVESLYALHPPLLSTELKQSRIAGMYGKAHRKKKMFIKEMAHMSRMILARRK